MNAKRQTVWITRALPAAESTAERVRALGHQAVVAPLLALGALDDVSVDLDGVGALAFTSANGVRYFAERCRDRALKVFAVGLATAQAAKQAGFRSVLSADGDVAALVRGIAGRAGELKGVVLHPGGRHLAGDLVGDLERLGVPARRLALYESAPVSIADPDTLLESSAVLLHSPRAASALATVMGAREAPRLRALGLSRAVLAPLASLKLAEKACPPFPLEAALLNLIDRRP